MILTNQELIRITKTDVETAESGKDKTTYTAVFENKDKDIKFSLTQKEEFELTLGEKYDLRIDSGQKKLTEVKK